MPPRAPSTRNSSPNDRTPTKCRPSASPPDTQIPRKPRTRESIRDAPKSGYRVSWHGCIPATKPADFLSLVALLETDKPPLAIIGRAVKVMREIADRPDSCGMIGKDII